MSETSENPIRPGSKPTRRVMEVFGGMFGVRWAGARGIVFLTQVAAEVVARRVRRPAGLALRAVAAVALTPIASGAPDNWPGFRGPGADGRSAATGLPVKFGENENMVWKTAIPGKAWSSPVVWGDRIWVTTATEDGHELGAVCVDAETGGVVRRVTVFKIAEPQFCHPMNSYATPTPVIEEGRIYLHYGSHGTACVDTATAAVVWSRQDMGCDHFRGAASSPVVVGNLLVLTFDGVDVQYLTALDKLTGKTVWKRDRDITYDTDNKDYHKAYSTPAVIRVAGRLQIVSPSAGATIAYEPATGEELWRVRSGGMNAAALPLYGQGMVFATSAAGGFQLFAVRPDGKGDVTGSHVAWKYARTVPSRSSPVLSDGKLFMVSDNGMVTCVDAGSGQAVWQKRIKGAFSASPLLAEGKIWFFGEDGEVPVIAAADTYQPLAGNHLGDGFMASPAVYRNSLVLRGRTHLYRIGRTAVTTD